MYIMIHKHCSMIPPLLKKLMYRKLSSQPIYLAKNTERLTPIWIQTFVPNFDNNEGVLTKSVKDLPSSV